MAKSHITHFDLDPNRLPPLSACMDHYDVGDPNAEWPNNLISRKAMVYASDVSHPPDALDPRVIELAKDADLLIHDAQFTPEEKQRFPDFGHSSWTKAVQVAQQAGVRQLALFHHDPMHSDNELEEIERQAQALFAPTFLAREGLELTL